MLGTFYCNGEKIFNVNVLMGIGTSQSIFSSWAQSYESSTFKMKYFETSTDSAIEEMAAGRLFKNIFPNFVPVLYNQSNSTLHHS